MLDRAGAGSGKSNRRRRCHPEARRRLYTLYTLLHFKCYHADRACTILESKWAKATGEPVTALCWHLNCESYGTVLPCTVW